MTLPTATYRLQFRNGMTFDTAIDLVPHLVRLGVSHLYCSPIFTAVTGSTHGYDISNPNEIDPDIGGRDGFERLANALSAADIGIILDIVPNHLAASLENPWWRSIIEWGVDSTRSGHFDVDWSRKLTLPILSAPLEQAVRDEAASIGFDARHGCLALMFLGSSYPLHPAAYVLALESIETPLADDIRALASQAQAAHEDQFHEWMRSLSQHADGLNAQLALSRSPEQIVEIIERQPWRPIAWQTAARDLSYRRFFEITGLVGVRVERQAVFDATHALIFDLVDKGLVQGLRVDHIDGLADPEDYLNLLRQRVGSDVYLVVEKILEHDEQLPPDWPVQGTTGYEFIATLSEIMLPEDMQALMISHQALAGPEYEPHGEFLRAKALMVDVNFQGEVAALQAQAIALAETEEGSTAPDPDAIAQAVRDILIAFPLYRTYGSPRGLTAQDDVVLLKTFENLYRRAGPGEAMSLRCLQAILRGEVMHDNAASAVEFRTRMQHLTGPLLAKALEDTFFYRHHRLLAQNEVGGDPLAAGGSVERFHQRMAQRALRQPAGLSTTSTHDTKRGEDARARLFTLAEAPVVWAEAVERWRTELAGWVEQLTDGAAPEPDVEGMLYQALAGAWRIGVDGADEASLAAFRDRFLAFVEKAVREAKLRGNWAYADNDYERAVKRYAERLLASETAAFRLDFEQTLTPFASAGYINSLSQTLIKLTAPGIPDIYQGSETFDFSLVDPDNRRLIDIDALSALDHGGLTGWPDSETELGAQKSALIASVLHLRRKHPALFADGLYLPLDIEGPRADHVTAFARVHADHVLITATLRQTFSVGQDLRGSQFWRDTVIILPEDLHGLAFVSIMADNADLTVIDHGLDAWAVFGDGPMGLCLAAR